MIDFEDALEQELVRAARRRSRVHSRALRRGVSLAPVLVSVTLALVIGAGAVLTLRTSHQGTAKPARGGYPAVVRRVIAEYAIFRRPQTAADRAVARKWLPTHTLWGLVRRVASRDGQATYVLLTLNHTHLGGQLMDTGLAPHGHGSDSLTFTPVPLRNSTPGSSIGRRQLVFVPDQVTRVVWKDYLNVVLTTRARQNVAYGPTSRLPWGFTTYAGSRQVDQEDIPEADIRLAATSGSSTATGQAEVSETNGISNIQLYVRHVMTGHRRYGIWLYSSRRHERYLGHEIGPVIWPHHSLFGSAAVPPNYRSYRELLITLQTRGNVTAPGKIVLQGDLPR